LVRFGLSADGAAGRKALALLLAIENAFTRPNLLRTISGFTDTIAQIGGEPALLGLQRGLSDTAG
jgi:hypothetical protein